VAGDAGRPRFRRADLRRWAVIPAPRYFGRNEVELLEGGDALFPRMCAAIAAAEREVWLATYIFHDDAAANRVRDALMQAAARGVAVHVVVDGFGSKAVLGPLRSAFESAGVQLEVFRPLERWYAWLQPGQLRRLHQKLCVCDDAVAFVGGINLIDDRHDMNHGWSDAPRLDFAVQLRGPLVQPVLAATRAMWARAHLAHAWRGTLRQLVRSQRRMREAAGLVRQLRGKPDVSGAEALDDESPMSAAFLVRDNFRQRRAIERSYVEAIRGAQERVDIAVPYFYPGRAFRRALRRAARRGVRVRLLLQGKVDYRIAALAARALYDELQGFGVRIFEYTPAFLHAKVALVDDRWATVGSSNIDPLSLLLNLEANIVVRDPVFVQSLADRFDAAFAVSAEVPAGTARGGGWRGWLRRAVVAAIANAYLRVAGITGRY
jgi:cardiolipin synthase